MNPIKSSITTSNAPDNIIMGASRFTKPLLLKVIGAFGIMILLLVILTIFSLTNLNKGKDASRQALDLQARATVLQRLREAIVSERLSILNMLYTGVAAPNLKVYQDTFDQQSIELLALGGDPFTFKVEHTKLIGAYEAVIKANQPGPAAQARELWKIADQQAETLLKDLDQKVAQANNSAMQAATRSDQVQNDASSSTLWLAVAAFLVIGFLTFFVMAAVIAPLRRLNENLSELLWNQTEHLTDRLNLLQAEININNDMMTTVRHDLKSPLGSIKGLAELCTILQPDLSRDVRENLEKIIQTSDTSVSTISNILARRKQKLDLQIVPLNNLVDKVLALVDLRYYNVQRKVEADAWMLDPGLMEHGLLNLVSNARKFSTSGIGIGVRKIRKAGTADQEELELWVWNDGAVINGEERNEIFKPGKQTEAGKKAGGHGLGLYIVKNIAERHYGRITVESHEKIGTTFRIFIPALSLSDSLEELPPKPSTETGPQDLSELLKI